MTCQVLLLLLLLAMQLSLLYQIHLDPEGALLNLAAPLWLLRAGAGTGEASGAGAFPQDETSLLAVALEMTEGLLPRWERLVQEEFWCVARGARHHRHRE